MTPEQLRIEQLREGQRLARCDEGTPQSARPRLGARPGYERPTQRPAPRVKPKNAPTGHQAFLKALQDSGAEIEVYMRDDETVLVGKIRAADAFTISLEVKGWTHVVFKHAIQQFKPLPRASTLITGETVRIVEPGALPEAGHFQ
jgi:sRNA-binding regulator protein Hfq